MKIYFCGSVRGGRADKDLYKDIIDHISQKHEVLTEHIGTTKVNLIEQGRKKDQLIYDKDTSFLKQADMIIAECTTPSLGVGYELAYAEKLGKPVHIFYRHSQVELSAMITGNPYFHIDNYETEDELKGLLDQLL